MASDYEMGKKRKEKTALGPLKNTALLCGFRRNSPMMQGISLP